MIFPSLFCFYNALLFNRACISAAQSPACGVPGFSPTCSHAVLARCHCAWFGEMPSVPQEDKT